ncbi:cation:proton antiporter [Elioraea tepida]|uniref:Cation:proton antiporter n=1 Tax=Elioraea tepida TaxID=2843330 RepID=A0A975YJD7_9PROT|nr:cation:proton antiporter [Elioraea tepida]QXM24715.1 cation:proton antiporter [Elioraea tepida]
MALEHSIILREVVVFLAAAGIAVPLMQRLRVSPVLGWLLAGLLVGPHGAARAADSFPPLAFVSIAHWAAIAPLAEIGVLFLMFSIGLELSFARLWAMRRLVFGLGAAQVLFSGAVIALVAWGFGNSPGAAIVLGACLALSSTAIVMQVLIEQRRVATVLGRSTFAVLLLQDLAVVPILFVVGVLGARAGDDSLAVLLASVLAGGLVVAVIWVVGRRALKPLFRLVGGAQRPELFMAMTLLTGLGAAWATAEAGLSAALGAFLAGLLIAETEYRHQVEADLEPFKGLLLGMFFMSVGMRIDPGAVAAAPVLLPLSAVGLIAVKAATVFPLCLAFGLPRPVAAEAALLLGQAGEFAFVVVALASRLGLLPEETANFMLLVAALTMAATPMLAAVGRRVAASMTGHAAETPEEPEEGLAGHVIIAGFGRVGEMLGRILDEEGARWVALDLDTAAVARHRQQGRPVFYADASRAEVLRRAGAAGARALVLTMDSPAAVQRALATARQGWPGLAVIARARDPAHAARLVELGATQAVPETVEAALALASGTLAALGVPDEVAVEAVARERLRLAAD